MTERSRWTHSASHTLPSFARIAPLAQPHQDSCTRVQRLYPDARLGQPQEHLFAQCFPVARASNCCTAPACRTRTVVRMLDYGQQPQAACDTPRWKVNRDFTVTVTVEATLDPSCVATRQRRGHAIKSIDDPYIDFGSGQFIWKLDRNELERSNVVASDSRPNGLAAAILDRTSVQQLTESLASAQPKSLGQLLLNPCHASPRTCLVLVTTGRSADTDRCDDFTMNAYRRAAPLCRDIRRSKKCLHSYWRIAGELRGELTRQIEVPYGTHCHDGVRFSIRRSNRIDGRTVTTHGYFRDS